MRNTRLILLEGLSGTGKSTTATYIALQLQHLGIPYRYHWEMELPHPVNMRTGFDTTVYTPAERIKLNLDKWRAFSAYACNRNHVTVLDGKPLHITLLYMILHDNITRTQLVDYVKEIAAIIRPLDPQMLYLRQEDLEQSVQKLEADRGQRWIQGMIDQIQERQTDKRMDFSGHAGLLRYYDYYRSLLEEALGKSGINSLSLDVSTADWPTYYDRIHSFLGLKKSYLGRQDGNRFLMSDTDGPTAQLKVENHTDRSLIGYNAPYKKRSVEYAFELCPNDTRIHQTSVGQRFRLHDTNSGAILQDLIVAASEQTLCIGDAYP